jgi:hypothetical protein
MTTGAAILLILAVFGGLGALYGLHRLALSLEERGYLYYRHKSSKGGAVGGFVAFQRIIEPQVQHVLKIKEEKQADDEGDPSGRGRPLDGRPGRWPTP